MSPAETLRDLLLIDAECIAWLPRRDSGDLLQVEDYTTSLPAADVGTLEGAILAAQTLLEGVARSTGGRLGPIDVLVSDHWLQWMTLPWSAEPPGSVAARQRAEAYFASVLADTQDPAQMAYFEAAAPHGAPRIIAAIDRGALAAIGKLGHAQGGRIASIRPLSLALWEAARAAIPGRDHVCAVLAGHLLVLLVAHAGGLRHLSVTRREGGSRGLNAAWRRLQLREPALKEAGPCYYLDLDAAGAMPDSGWTEVLALSGHPQRRRRLLRGAGRRPWLHALDFSGSPPGSSRLQLAAAAAGGLLLCASLAAAAWQAQGLAQARGQAESRQAAAAPRPLPLDQQRRLARQVETVNTAIRQINIPVPQLLGAINPPEELDVALLGVDFKTLDERARGGRLSVSAQTLSASDMAAYVGHLAHSAPLQSASLARHETVTVNGQDAIRFMVDVGWGEP